MLVFKQLFTFLKVCCSIVFSQWIQSWYAQLTWLSAPELQSSTSKPPMDPFENEAAPKHSGDYTTTFLLHPEPAPPGQKANRA